MHIKQVIISGFRSFRNQHEIEPFSPSHNAVVGRNGSGKSNFFDAIQFVLLAPKFVNLRQDERQHLLHEGAGANVMSAFVEVIFDNSDGRIAQDGDEVVLRRTIGLKKDEFFLNRKRVTKQEVSSLLESAGFSKSNPYYIVQQGKVANLCLMRDEERLNLLKEVGGTKVYEERRQESLNIMAETASKRDKIQEMISYIEGRLQELEGEKDELRQYQALDRERRALQYTLCDKELAQARADLERLERHRASGVDDAQGLHEAAFAARDRLAAAQKDLRARQQELVKLNSEKEKVENIRMELIQERARLDLKVNELTEKVQTEQTSQEEMREELAELETRVAAAEEELKSEAEPAHTAAKATVDEITALLKQLNREREELYAKKSRGSQFDTAEERDAFLEKEIKEVQDQIKVNQAGLAQVEAEAAEKAAALEADRAQRRRWEEEVAKRQRALQETAQLLQERVAARNALHEGRKAAWRELEVSRAALEETRGERDRAERALRAALPRAVAQGLEAVQKIVAKENISGYYGPVIENFQLVDSKFQTAVEVAAGNALFHAIVDTDATAARLMRTLEKHRLGRVTFMPLNKLRVKKYNYPDSPEVVPLISCALQFDPRVEAAMLQVFGRKLIARNQEVAAHFSSLANMDAITLDGDEVNRKGAIQGGFYDERANRLAMMEKKRKADQELQPMQEKHDDMDRKVREVDQQITGLLGQIQKLEAKKQNLSHRISEQTKDATLLGDKVDKAAELLERQQERLLPQLRQDLAADGARAEALRAELGTPLQATLSPEEQRRLATLQEETTTQAEALQAREAELAQAAGRRHRLQALLKNNLGKRRQELKAALNPAGKGGQLMEREGALQQAQASLQSTTSALEANKANHEEVKQALKASKADIKKLKNVIEEASTEDATLQEKIAETTKSAEKMLNKRGMLLQKREDNTRKIQELGSLPAAEVESHKDRSIKDLMKRLHKCNEKLKKFSHVNKKALDQYVNFSEQRGLLMERRDEVDRGAKAIEELIEHLDQQKDEAILRTFKGVSHHFSEVFRSLVPDGKGEMLMKTAADQNEEDDGAEESKGGDSNPTSVNQFVGVQIRVSFSGNGEQFLMSQLSGGQKALVALAIIFAIQRCDPAPFYLFDELDQALDSSYRAQVAALIQQQARDEDNPAQFITSTFRPELVSVADKTYGISHQNKVSNINPMGKEDALDFVRDLMNEEERVDGEEGAKQVPAPDSSAAGVAGPKKKRKSSS